MQRDEKTPALPSSLMCIGFTVHANQKKTQTCVRNYCLFNDYHIPSNFFTIPLFHNINVFQQKGHPYAFNYRGYILQNESTVSLRTNSLVESISNNDAIKSRYCSEHECAFDI